MSQQHLQRKFYPCRGGCQTQVFFDNNHKSQSGKFIPLELDSIGQVQRHDCPNRKKEQQQQQQQPSNDLSKEIASIKAQLLVLIGRLDRLEQELQK